MPEPTHVRITIDVPIATWEAFDDWLTDLDMPDDMGAIITDYEAVVPSE